MAAGILAEDNKGEPPAGRLAFCHIIYVWFLCPSKPPLSCVGLLAVTLSGNFCGHHNYHILSSFCPLSGLVMKTVLAGTTLLLVGKILGKHGFHFYQLAFDTVCRDKI
jgi:hypothetical protein